MRNNKNKRVAELFERCLSDQAVAGEREEWMDYVQDPLYAEDIQELIGDAFENPSELLSLSPAGQDRVLGRILKKERSTVKLWPRIAAAVAIIFVIGAGLFHYVGKDNDAQPKYENDVLPGKVGATLVLSNGQKIVLSETVNGDLAKESGVVISKTASGQLTYEVKDQVHAEAGKVINTLSTARGETYQVKLPDGTSIWLNAGSVLKYPASFAGLKSRDVELIGEAYFEVSRDKSHPFFVESKGQRVEVLGTHFNVSAYLDDASIKTTLVEGRVRVSTESANKTIIPGQQAVNNAGGIKVVAVNAEDVIAWKNDLFVFEDEPLESIMRKVARWYDVSVVYDGADRQKLFGGNVSRYDNISKLLEKLEMTGGVHFEVSGKKVIVKDK